MGNLCPLYEQRQMLRVDDEVWLRFSCGFEETGADAFPTDPPVEKVQSL